MRIAYLVNQYPSVSHSFIRREILALERQGVAIARFSVRRSKTEFLAEEDKEEAAKTRIIVGAGAPALVAAIGRSFIMRPLQSLAALGGALRMGARSEAGLLRHLFYWAEALALADWMGRERLAHVHAHFGTNSATVAMLAARVAGASFSMTVHGPEEFDKPGLIALPEKMKKARFVVAVSRYGASQLRRFVPPTDWSRIQVVPCGVDRAFHEGAPLATPDATRFCSVGRLSAQKGQVTLVEAAAILRRKGVRFSILLVGDGEMRRDIENAARRLGVSDCIEFAGWRTPAEVRRAIESCRAFVLPSYAEGLPVSIMEAFALGRPVISTYVAGVPELVAPGVNGWLAPAGDAEALAAAMAEALALDEAAARRMGAEGRARVLALHDIDLIAVRLKALFAQALAAGDAA
ncbi:MAG: glycosyltransferase [Parvularculaceae bacterium]|jgi:glycosyltransferase involved in cell wall biosynthesis|nr:glycosyltransferase [Parvularculaceae bacterium]